MILSMTKAKIAVTIDQDVLAKVRQAVADGVASSVSAYVEEAVTTRLTDEMTASEWLDQILEESGGPLTDEERAWADRVLRWGS
jgi:Arc/MetJ-type ribon-helix-helix transcriptional regulator